jgi:hypothetical protein
MAKSDHLRSDDELLDATENQIPRKSFLGMLLAGGALLAPFRRIARAEAPHLGSGVKPSVTPTGGATKVMVIRHAEKPVVESSGATYLGIDENGNPDPNSLIPRGWQRAGALVPLFGSSFGPLPTPSFLFAPNVFGSGSKRPFETITPLAAKLGITMNATAGGVSPGQYAPGDYHLMVPDALACPGTVLIAWEHEDIPSIANLILSNTSTVPQTWPGARFDVVWTFDLNAATNAYIFNQLPQLLLQGDLPTPIPLLGNTL